MARDTAFLAEIIEFGFDPQEEVSLMSYTLQLSSFTRKQLYRRLKEAYASGSLKLVKRIHALLALAQGQSVSEVADMMSLGEQTVRDYRNQFLLKGIATGGVNIGNAHAVLPQHCRNSDSRTTRKCFNFNGLHFWLS
jgi:hypothetical protein